MVGRISRSTRCSTTARKPASTTSDEGVEVVAAVADAVRLSIWTRSQFLQFLEAGAHVFFFGPGNGELVGDLLGGERLGRQVKQGMDLGDGAIDAPSGCPSHPSGG